LIEELQAEPGGGVLPDGYRPAVSDDVPEGRACGNCAFYDESLTQQVDDGVEVWCRLWAAFVRGDFYCDRWQPNVEESGKDYEKKEQRQVDTDPPDYIRNAAARGLELRAEGFGGAGLTDKTIREARDMAAGRVSEDKVIRAAAWGARHAVDLDAPQNSNASDDGWPGAGAVAHYLWGINPLNPGPARAWFERKSEQIKDERSKEPPMKRGQMKQVREVRNYGLTDVEVREEDDGAVSFNGYATVFNRNYEVFDSYGMFQERIAPSAFDRTLREEPDVVLVINHAGLPLARTKSGTLRLEPDAIGLRVFAELDQGDPDVQALLPKMRRGDVDEMSFAFRVVDDVWTEDYSEREITQVNLHRGDVSVVTFGANPHTMAMVRAALADESVREQLAADPQVARVLTTASVDENAAEEPAPAPAKKKAAKVEPVAEVDDEERSAEDVDWAVTVMARLLETKKVS
jgi:HK97 family phage prohead protease